MASFPFDTSATNFRSTRQPTWQERFGARRPLTASTRIASAQQIELADWNAKYTVREQTGEELPQ